MNKKCVFGLLGLVAVTSFLPGCTTVNPYTGQQEVSKSTIGAGVGAAGGALLGAIVGGGRGAAIGAAAGGLTGTIVGAHMDQQASLLRQKLVNTGVQVRQLRNGRIQLIMNSDVTFRLNSASIKPYFYGPLSSVADVLQKYKRTNVMIYGYTDSTGSAAYNQRLSEQRAASVGYYLINQGVKRDRIFTKGFGKRHYIASNETARGRRMNRRVVITLRPMG